MKIRKQDHHFGHIYARLHVLSSCPEWISIKLSLLKIKTHHLTKQWYEGNRENWRSNHHSQQWHVNDKTYLLFRAVYLEIYLEGSTKCYLLCNSTGNGFQVKKKATSIPFSFNKSITITTTIIISQTKVTPIFNNLSNGSPIQTLPKSYTMFNINLYVWQSHMRENCKSIEGTRKKKVLCGLAKIGPLNEWLLELVIFT